MAFVRYFKNTKHKNEVSLSFNTLTPMPVFDLSGIEIINFTGSDAWNTCFTLMLREDVSEIVSNGPNQFFLSQKGIRKRIPVSKMTEEEYVSGVVEMSDFIENSTPIQIDEYIKEGRLRYSYKGQEVRGRCHIMLNKVADYPQVTIAKKSTSLITLDKIASNGSMSTDMMEFLKDAIKADLCIVFSGSTGSGKTTMLEASSKYIANSQRIGVAEDAPELVLSQENVTYLRSFPKKPGMDEKDQATLEWVVAQFMRNRCDRLIVGETRGAEFGGFLTGANSGMEGCITTLHADDPDGCLRKMNTFALMAMPSLPTRAINQSIANAVDIVVQLIKTKEGNYRTSYIQEISSTLGNDEQAKVASATLYQWDEKTDSFIQRNVISDSLRRKLDAKGIDLTKYISGDKINKEVKHHRYESQRIEKAVSGDTERIGHSLPKADVLVNLPSLGELGL